VIIEKRDLLPERWNLHVFSELDFDSICIKEGIQAFESSMLISGAYCVYDGSPVIFIRRDLPGPEKLFIKFHELAHHWLHFPGVQFFLNTHSKIELEANIVAACALVPRTELLSRSAAEICEEYGYRPELLALRADIYRMWDI